jgi:hypothetical protein
VAGDYHYWVQNFTGTTFDQSHAVVSVVLAFPSGLQLLATYSVTGATGVQNDDIWYVVDLTIDALGNVTVTQIHQVLQPGTPSTVL